MTTTPDLTPPLYDAGNELLSAGQPANLVTGFLPVEGGVHGVLTIRTQTTTLSLSLPKEGLHRWRQMIDELDDSLSSGGLVTAQPAMPRLLRPV